MAAWETTMTLPIGNSRSETRPQRAFTLVELIIVMTLLAIVISVAAPTLANFFRGRSLDSEARRLLALTRHGQGRAVSEGVPMLLWVDAVKRTYGLEEEPGYTDSDPKAVDFTLDKDLKIEVINSGIANVVATANLAPSTGTGSGNTLSGENHGNLPAMRFLPDGSISETSVQGVRLLDRDGVALWLTLSRNRLYYEIRNQTNQWDGVN